MGARPIAGFGGRLYFYNRDNEPIQVDGQLVVYAFEGDQAKQNGNRPDRKFVITPEQLATHFTTGSAGPSYSVWLPWAAVGGPAKKVNLIPTFVPRDGQVIVGNEARQLLPDGKAAMPNVRQSGSSNSVKPVTYVDSSIPSCKDIDPETDEDDSSSQLNATTIPVPWTMQKWMQSPSGLTPSWQRTTESRGDDPSDSPASGLHDRLDTFERIRQGLGAESNALTSEEEKTESVSADESNAAEIRQSAARFGPSLLRAPSRPFAQPLHAPPSWQQSPAGWQLRPPLSAGPR